MAQASGAFSMGIGAGWEAKSRQSTQTLSQGPAQSGESLRSADGFAPVVSLYRPRCSQNPRKEWLELMSAWHLKEGAHSAPGHVLSLAREFTPNVHTWDLAP